MPVVWHVETLFKSAENIVKTVAMTLQISPLEVAKMPLDESCIGTLWYYDQAVKEAKVARDMMVKNKNKK
jgi:hypothetical protein